MPGTHAKLSASSMDRWEACPKAPSLCAGLPDTAGAAAKEGSYAHDWAEKFCRYHLLGADVPNLTNDYNKLDEEMRTSIWIYFETLQKLYKPEEGDKLWLEVELKGLKDIHPDCGGTADAIVWKAKTQILYVVDFKYGKGHHVQAEGNSQLQVYGLGGLVTMDLPAKRIIIVVVQPRCPSKTGKVREWKMEPLEILDFEDRYVKAAEATLDPDAKTNVGRWCFFCPAQQLNKCPAHWEAKLEKAQGEFKELPDEEDDPFADDEDDPFN